MRNGKNVKGYEFEVVDEDGKAITGFDTHCEAVKFAKSLPWYYGDVWIRRDEGIVKRRAEYEKKLRDEYRLEFMMWCA